MHAIDTAYAVNGQFTDGDPLTGIPATEVDSPWLNDLQGNLLGVLAAAGIAPVKGSLGQLAAAIAELIATAIAAIPAAEPVAGGGAVVDQVGPYGMPTRAAIPGASNDLNSLVQSGFYLAPPGALNVPAGAGNGLVFSVGNTAANGGGAHIFVDTLTSKCWVRGRNVGVWGAWSALTPAPAPTVSLGVNGYKWNAVTGELRQWGYVQGSFSEGVVNIAFQVEFDTCFGIAGHVVNTAADISIGTWIDEVAVGSASASVLVNRVSSGSDNIPGFKWEAHGVAAAFNLVGASAGSGSGAGSVGGGSGGGNGGSQQS